MSVVDEVLTVNILGRSKPAIFKAQSGRSERNGVDGEEVTVSDEGI